MDPLSLLAFATLAAAVTSSAPKKKNAIVQFMGFDLLLDDAGMSHGQWGFGFPEHPGYPVNAAPTVQFTGTPAPGQTAQLERLVRKQGLQGQAPPVVLFEGRKYPFSWIWNWKTDPRRLAHVGLADSPFQIEGILANEPAIAELDEYQAVLQATLEIWGKHPDKDPIRLIETASREWLVPGDPAGWTDGEVIATVFHEYAAAPREPFHHDQRRPDPENSEHRTWERVQERLEEQLPREPYIESVNPAVSVWVPSYRREDA